ncbi:MAG: hypothetical protein ACI88A_001335 [Paraglaciecola sp.]
MPIGTDLIRQSFTIEEVVGLQNFTATFDKSDINLGDVDRTIDDLIVTPDWVKVIDAASNALEILK